MAIEKIEMPIKVDGSTPQPDGNLPAQNHGIVTNNLILAGLVVRHKLLPHRYLLDGFIVEDFFFDSKVFATNGITIEYGDPLMSKNPKVYSKLVVDSKNKAISEYGKMNKKFHFRSSSTNSPKQYEPDRTGDIYIDGKGWVKFEESRFEYYLYETNTATEWECVANRVFALCKYYEEGEFKYSIFNLHEIVPE